MSDSYLEMSDEWPPLLARHSVASLVWEEDLGTQCLTANTPGWQGLVGGEHKTETSHYWGTNIWVIS